MHRKSRGGTAEGEVVAGDKVEVKGQRTETPGGQRPTYAIMKGASLLHDYAH